jgi:DNA-binding CsgD family transcriptional regulator
VDRRTVLFSRVREQIADACSRGLDLGAFKDRVLRTLRRAVPVDAAFFATADPDTLLLTAATADAVLWSAQDELLRNELEGSDVNTFAGLAQARSPVSSLFAATDGAMASSQRFTDILEPLHLGDELRLALISRRACWGYLCLHRELGARPFSAQEAAFVVTLAPLVAEGLRAAVTMPRAGDLVIGGPGVILLGPGLELVGADDAARAWLEELWTDDRRGVDELPVAVLAVATRLRAAGQAGATAALPAIARLRARSGTWLGLRASWLTGPGMGSAIAVVLEPPPAPQLMPLLARAHGLTAREGELVRLLIRGLPTAELADRLHISEHTVQDHLKSIFDKVGVHSRRELLVAMMAAPPSREPLPDRLGL